MMRSRRSAVPQRVLYEEALDLLQRESAALDPHVVAPRRALETPPTHEAGDGTAIDGAAERPFRIVSVVSSTPRTGLLAVLGCLILLCTGMVIGFSDSAISNLGGSGGGMIHGTFLIAGWMIGDDRLSA
jgi:hypothetical protein